jgi:hypothetical protein
VAIATSEGCCDSTHWRITSAGSPRRTRVRASAPLLLELLAQAPHVRLRGVEARLLGLDRLADDRRHHLQQGHLSVLPEQDPLHLGEDPIAELGAVDRY